MLHHRRTIVALAVCVVSACSDNTTEPIEPEPTGLRILAGDTGTDTIGAQFAQALLVELRDEDGRVLPDRVLRFNTLPVDATRPNLGNSAYLSAVDRNDLRTFLSDTTDAQGRARVLVTLGLKAGPALVIVSDPDRATADTATFTVEPGNGVAVLASPRDTAVYVSKTVVLRSAVVDRAGNPRSDAVTHTVVGSAVTVSGSTVTASALGFARVVTSAGSMSDTTRVAVPPEGTLAAVSSRGLVVFNTDGSDFRVVWPLSFPNGRATSWSPNGQEIAFELDCCDRFQIANVGGGARFITPQGSGTLYPRFSRDGQWVYFTRLSRLQRAHPDGTGEEAVPIVNPGVDSWPAFSPDGSRAVIVRLFSNQLLMLDLATGVTTDLALVGQSPAWSAASNLIAFLSSPDGNTIRVMNPDGTGLRTVASLGYGLNLDWSPDGQWIVARSTTNNRLELINATSGAIIPLSFTGGYTAPSWKP